MSFRISKSASVSASVFAIMANAAFAGFTDHQRIDARQPDGSSIPLVVTGDEFHRRLESPEGQTLVRDGKTGWYDLARYNSASRKLESRGIHWSGKLAAAAKAPSAGVDLPAEEIASVRAQGRNHRSWSMSHPPAPLAIPRGFSLAPVAGNINDGYTGAILGLTLLIDFQDDVANWSPAIIDSVMNAEGYSRQGVETSIYDFYKEVSGNKLRYHNIVMDHYYRAPQPKAYYQDFYHMLGLIREVLQHLDNGGFDFSRLTTGSDGQVRALNVLYAGGTNSTEFGLWPHTGVLEDGSFAADGVWFSRHEVCWLQHDIPFDGTIAHENGHLVMGWPDLYDNDGSSAGVGPYSLMGFDNWAAPQRPDASLRLQAGWDEIVDLNGMPAGSHLSIGSTQNRIFRWNNPANPNETFLIDARPTISRHWPHAHGGLAIWHVDRAKDVNVEEQRTDELHYRVSLEQSDGTFGLEGGNGEVWRNIFFHSGTQSEFHDGTLPNARWWSGDESGLHLVHISGEPTPRGANSVMTFDLGAPPVLARYNLATTPGQQGQVATLPANCNLVNGAQGTQPAGSVSFGSVPHVGDRVYLNADGSSYATAITSASPWWLGFNWAAPYVGPGSRNGACSVLRGPGARANGNIVPQGPLQVTQGRTQTFRFYPHAGFIIGDVRVDGVSQGPVTEYTLHDIAANHSVNVDFVPGQVAYHLVVQGENGPGSYTGSGDWPAETWVNIGATPGAGFRFDHWRVTYGKARIEDERANPTRVFLDHVSVVLAVYTQGTPPCGGTPEYREGSTYATGAVVFAGTTRYECLVGGWCSAGGPYAPGTGWAWRNAWRATTSCP